MDRRGGWRWVRMGLVGLAGTFLACRKAQMPPPQVRESSRARVRVMAVETGRITQRIDLTGEVRPWRIVQLASKVSGRLVRLALDTPDGSLVPISEGTPVRQGSVLAVIDPAVYETRVRQAEAARAMAEAQYQEALREEQRARTLFEEGSVTEQMRDKAATARAVAEAARAQAEAALALARLDLDESRARSPLDGVVTRRHVDEGNLVAVGTPLVTIEEVGKVKILVTIPERHLPAVEAGRTRVRVRSDGLPDQELEAVVARVHPTVDPATRTGTLEMHLDNPGGKLRPGGFVHVQVELAHGEGAVIPLRAVIWEGRDAYVFVVEEGRIRRRPVRVGLREGDRCQILEGLQPGDALILEGFRDLRDGDAASVETGGAA